MLVFTGPVISVLSFKCENPKGRILIRKNDLAFKIRICFLEGIGSWGTELCRYLTYPHTFCKFLKEQSEKGNRPHSAQRIRQNRDGEIPYLTLEGSFVFPDQNPICPFVQPGDRPDV